MTDHDASMVFAMLKRIVTAAKVLLPNLQFVHYLSDSPSSQYRNRHIIRVISDHKSIFGVDCTWTWFESGHRKGPCDGVGGTAKRNADMAVKRLDANISNAHSFAEWGNQSGGKLEYEVVNGAEYDAAKVELNQMEAKVVAGSQSFHAAIPVGNGDVLFRNTSCFCADCFVMIETPDGHGEQSKCNWKRVKVTPEVQGGQEHVAHERDEAVTQEVEEAEFTSSVSQNVAKCRLDLPNADSSFCIGDFVLVQLQNKYTVLHYVALILDTDSDDENDYEVMYLKKKQNMFIQDEDDIAGIKCTDIVLKLPVPSKGSTKRSSEMLCFQFDFTLFKLG